MRIAIPYFIMGFLFTYLAYLYTNDTVWNALTILLVSVATFDFLIGFHFLFHRPKKEEE